MLSRAARQKNALFHLRKANAIRTLGVSPAVRLHSNSSRPTPIVNSQSTSTQDRPRRPSFQSHRNLATAADPSVLEQGSSYMQDASPYHPGITSPSAFQMSDSFDTSSLIVLNETPQTQPKILRKIRGIGGDEDEMMANFDMSLRVRRFDRAAALISRLKAYYPVDSAEFLALHNKYLKAMVSHMIVTRQNEMVLPLQKWFEVDMPSGGVRPDATTFAVMVRMSLRMLHGSKRERSVRRYWGLAKQADLHEDLLASEILTDLDLGELSKICYSDLLTPMVDPAKIDEEFSAQSTNIVDNLPEVLAAEQKGLGLSSLKESLSLFSEGTQIALPEGFKGTEEEKRELYAQLRQQRLESDTMRTASKRWRAEFEGRVKSGVDLASGKSRLKSVMSQWHTDLSDAIKKEIKLAEEAETQPMRTEEQKARCEYGVYLQSLDSDRLAAVTVLSVMDVFTRHGMQKGTKVSTVAASIGKGVQDELIAEAYLKENTTPDSRRVKMVKDMLAGRRSKDGRPQWTAVSENMKKEHEEYAWTPRVTVRIGAVLMGLLFDVAKAPVKATDPQTGNVTTIMHPAFLHAYEMNFGKRLGLFHMNPEIIDIISREPPADLLGRHLPMICKPQSWTGAKKGGYRLYQSNIVRSTPGETLQPAYVKAALEKDGLKDIRKGLDVLGNTGWVINHDVFEVMLEAWNSGEGIASLAPLDPDLTIPPKPEPDAGFAAERDWQLQMRDIENLRSGYHSMRCFQNFQLEVARAFRNEVFYLPHNIDFRGRAYPLPPYLNQMGADNARGLLLFSEAKPLGAGGLRWLKIQIANLAGFDKASMSEREQFAMDHLEDVLDSANKGLHGKRWWLKAEDPWQCLAACCELRNALALPDPTTYASRLPIHQDGSCNGLQHYAALGGDTVGAQQVNLEPSDRPSDVYTGVSDFVKKSVAKDAAEGHKVAQVLDGRITRKVVKQTVMTNVYGVTFMGAMRQVRRQLNDHFPDLSNEMKKDGALYIARKIFEALGSMFNGAHEIQYWLGDCATRITQSLTPEQIETMANDALSPSRPSEKGTSTKFDPSKKFQSTVIWTTPLGLPVVQPYRTRKARRVVTSLQTVSIVDPSAEDVVSRRKQLQAFPPNFIHSLDATHMIMSANACNDAGLTFSAVHDSFWTHAGDVDSMNSILRDAFVHMHSDDIVGRLAAEFNVRYGKNLFLAKVDSNSEIGRTLRKRRQPNLRNARLVELIDEHRRQTLLRSDDPADQAEGRAMETSAAIFEKMGGTDDHLALASTLGETTVGHVPDDLAAAERGPSSNVDTSDPAIQSLFTEIDMMDAQSSSADAETDGAMAAEGGAGEEKQATKQKKRQKPHTWLWLPLRFRPVPTKGSWDLSRIRDSQYFFS